MAQDDERPQPRGLLPGAIEPPEHVKKPQLFEISPGSGTKPDGDAANGSPAPKRPTLTEGLQSIKADDFTKVHRIPCARDGFMTGIIAGGVAGAGRFVFGGRIPRAFNWACGAFLIGAVSRWEYCQYQRQQERAAMARVVEVMDRKQAEKKQKAADAARLRAEAEEKARQEAASKKRWYRLFW